MDFNQMGKLMALAGKMDLDKVAKLAETIDLGELIGLVSKMDAGQLQQMTHMLKGAAKQNDAPPRELPAPDGDFYDFYSLLTDEQRGAALRLRAFMEEEVRPVINDWWQRDETPREMLVAGFQKLGLIEHIFDKDGNRTPHASLMEGIFTVEMARVDVSTATFFGVHAGLALWSIVMGADEQQKKRWLPDMLTMDTIGCFGLTEPDVGSAAAGGLTTTCTREGDEWVLSGQKKWIGNALFADLIVIFARDTADGKVKGFVVTPDNPGFAVEKIEGKIALRAVENGLITLTDCRVPESDRLQQVTGWRVVADILRATRAGVAWQGAGCARGAYERALAYTQQREQFGRPVASFQLVQQHLVNMLARVTSSMALCMRLSQMQDQGVMLDEHASLAKVYTAKACREAVALAREVLGGNGILLEYEVARYFCDTEAIYSYEGTNEINSLVVGRAITGISAFV
jgi:glutaryl-CoA dehydrogenase